jgi:predicted dehydrogenase
VVPVGLGFAGLGWLGDSLLAELPAFPEFRLAAVQDRDAGLAVAVAARHAAPWHGSSFDELLGAPGVEAVVICTPNALHAPQAQAALRAGKHVLVQKPLAVSPDAARATVELAGRLSRILFVDYSYRQLATVRALREALPAIGRPRRAAAAFHNIYGPGKAWFFNRELSGGGALIDLGVHLLDLAIDLLDPATISLRRADLATADAAVEHRARLDLRLDDLPLTVDVSWNAAIPTTEIALQVDGDRGTLRWENVAGSFFRFRSLRDGALLLDRETTLRADTLAAFGEALRAGAAPPVHLQVYELLAEAYGAGRERG